MNKTLENRISRLEKAMLTNNEAHKFNGEAISLLKNDADRMYKLFIRMRNESSDNLEEDYMEATYIYDEMEDCMSTIWKHIKDVGADL